MRCTACRKKCFPIDCAHCGKSICIPCRAPDKHECITKDELRAVYEEKLQKKMDATGKRNPGTKHWDE
jgi:hypothetical protein